MKLSDQQWEFLKDLSKLYKWAEDAGWKLSGGDMKRTEYQQKEYFRQGLSKTMDSKHLMSLAWDAQGIWFEDGTLFNSLIPGHIARLKPMADYWRSLNPNNISGSDWGWDYQHFQRSPQP